LSKDLARAKGQKFIGGSGTGRRKAGERKPSYLDELVQNNLDIPGSIKGRWTKTTYFDKETSKAGIGNSRGGEDSERQKDKKGGSHRRESVKGERQPELNVRFVVQHLKAPSVLGAEGVEGTQKKSGKAIVA